MVENIVEKNESKLAGLEHKKIIYSFLGAPGSGKGTLADQCVDKLGFIMLSTGNLCRDHIKAGTDLGKKLQEFTSKGVLVPDDIITSMVKGWLDEHIREGKTIILDGFPRTEAQALQLQELIKNNYPDYQFNVVEFKIPESEVVERMAGRLMCSNKECKAIYNVKQFPGVKEPRCLKCSSPLIKREDDREEVIRDRMRVYAQTSKDLVDFYNKNGIKLQELNVSGKEPAQVFDMFKELIQ